MQRNRLAALVLRDALLLGATAALWAYVVQAGPTGGSWAAVGGVATALMTVLMGYLGHEWGHLAGAWLSGAVVHLPPSPVAVFLFRFDTVQNGRRQFLCMSAGGFISSAIIVAFLFVALPRGLFASHVALSLTVLGVLATFILEIPSAWKVWRGGAMPQGAAFVSSPGAAD